jgi:hypothetical protein
VVYRGRTGCCSGEDQINVVIPPGVAGCVAPVTFKIGSLVSNTATIPIAAGGRSCTPTVPGLTSSDYQRLLTKPQMITARVTLDRTVNTTAGIAGFGAGTTRSDDGAASFVRFTAPATAVLNSFSGQRADPFGNLIIQALDAGPSVGISGPNGTKSLSKLVSSSASYSAKLGSGAPGDYLDTGPYTINTAGGANIGDFTTKLNIPPALTWTNQSSVSPVNRANGVTVTWSGGDPAGYVKITGSGFIVTDPVSGNGVSASFTCTARTADGSFTVPSMILLALPASASIGSFALPGTISVGSVSSPVQIQATGLDFGTVTSTVTSSTSVIFQ